MADTFYWGNRYWGRGDKVAFARYLLRHGVQFNAWARNHPTLATRMFGGGGGGVATPATKPKSILEIATERYDQLTKPQIDALNQQREEARASSERMMQNTRAMYAALAGALGSIGPSISNAYQAGAGEIGSLGKGFADAGLAVSKAEGDKAAGYLSAAGAPAAGQDAVRAAAGGTDAADVVYGLGGYIPASTMAREGAAFGAAGAMLPAQAAGEGMMQLRSVLQDALANDKDWADKITQITGSRTTDIEKIVSEMEDQARAERAQRIQEQYLLNTLRGTDARLTGVDPATGLPTYDSRQDAAKIARDAKSKNAARRDAAIKARESAFEAAQKSIFSEATSFRGKEMTLDDKIAWAAAHKRPLSAAPKYQGGKSYAQAKKALFDKYSYLLKYATAAGKAALKRRLNQIIDQALAAAGIHPSSSAAAAAGAAAAGAAAWSLAP